MASALKQLELPSDVWTARYEDLRRQVVEERRELGRGAGLALLVHRGVTAWMQAFPEDIGLRPPPDAPKPLTPGCSSPDDVGAGQHASGARGNGTVIS